MLSPFFACCFSIAKMRSCLRIRLAPSSSFAFAISTSSVTGLDLSSDRCIVGGTYNAAGDRAADAAQDDLGNVGAGTGGPDGCSRTGRALVGWWPGPA